MRQSNIEQNHIDFYQLENHNIHPVIKRQGMPSLIPLNRLKEKKGKSLANLKLRTIKTTRRNTKKPDLRPSSPSCRIFKQLKLSNQSDQQKLFEFLKEAQKYTKSKQQQQSKRNVAFQSSIPQKKPPILFKNHKISRSQNLISEPSLERKISRSPRRTTKKHKSYIGYNFKYLPALELPADIRDQQNTRDFDHQYTQRRNKKGKLNFWSGKNEKFYSCNKLSKIENSDVLISNEVSVYEQVLQQHPKVVYASTQRRPQNPISFAQNYSKKKFTVKPQYGAHSPKISKIQLKQPLNTNIGQRQEDCEDKKIKEFEGSLTSWKQQNFNNIDGDDLASFDAIL